MIFILAYHFSQYPLTCKILYLMAFCDLLLECNYNLSFWLDFHIKLQWIQKHFDWLHSSWCQFVYTFFICDFLMKDSVNISISLVTCLSFISSVLQTKANVPGLEDTLVACLDRIFKTNYGACLLTNYAVCIILFFNGSYALTFHSFCDCWGNF